MTPGKGFVCIVVALAIGCGGSEDGAAATPTPGPMDKAGIAVEAAESSKTTEDVLAHHLEAFGSGNLDAILADYTAESVLFTPLGVLEGPEAMTPLFEGLFAEFAKPGMKFKMERQLVVGELALIVWSAETADNVYEMATDTFVIRDGKIVAQTFAGKITPKRGAAPAMGEAPPPSEPPAEGSTLGVLFHHLQAFGALNMDDLLSDYGADSFLLSPMGEVAGTEGLRVLFDRLFAEFARPGVTFTLHKVLTHGDVAYIIWSAETADNVYELATDTFVIRDGTIVSQTFAAKVVPKSP